MSLPFETPLQKLIREAAEREACKKMLLGGLLGITHTSPFARSLSVKPKRNVFVSYHHENDQRWADHFRKIYSDQYDIFYDASLDEEVDSDDPDYINRIIREDYIAGSSITIVLCGAETYKRRFIDWEIYSTLHHEHGLLGIALPTAVKGLGGRTVVPSRLHDNVESGYAHWILWPATGVILKSAIEVAISKSSQTRLIRNGREKMKRSSL